MGTPLVLLSVREPTFSSLSARAKGWELTVGKPGAWPEMCLLLLMAVMTMMTLLVVIISLSYPLLILQFRPHHIYF